MQASSATNIFLHLFSPSVDSFSTFSLPLLTEHVILFLSLCFAHPWLRMILMILCNFTPAIEYDIIYAADILPSSQNGKRCFEKGNCLWVSRYPPILPWSPIPSHAPNIFHSHPSQISNKLQSSVPDRSMCTREMSTSSSIITSVKAANTHKCKLLHVSGWYFIILLQATHQIIQ